MKQTFFSFLAENKSDFFRLIGEHLQITFFAVLIAILIGVPVGILITKSRIGAKIVLMIANIFQTIPSLALFGLIIPILGIGAKPAIFVLFLYALLPIIKNTYIGIMGVDPSSVESGRGMGMKPFQILYKVQIPQSMPVIMAGIRISTVINIGTATIASLIGAGGLGDFIFQGISLANNNAILAGAIPTALLAIVIDLMLGFVEKEITPKGVKSLA